MGRSLFTFASARQYHSTSASKGCRGMVGAVFLQTSKQVSATIHAETCANTAEINQIKNFNDSPMSV
jgi:hypothetical protein